MKLAKGLLSGLALTMIAGAASAVPVQWAGNGHWYEVIESPMLAPDAFTDAAGRSHLGETGYVVTITSADEQAFIEGMISASYGTNRKFWIGATDVDSEGNWVWANGPEAGMALSYDNFHATQPDNLFGNQDYAAFAYANTQTWGDYNGVNGVNVFYSIVEYYGEYIAPVPVPGGLPLAAGALGLLAFASRRRKS